MIIKWCHSLHWFSFRQCVDHMSHHWLSCKTVCCLWTHFTWHFIKLCTGSFSNTHQLLYNEMMLKIVKSIWWNLKFLPAQGTRYFITWILVLKIILETLEAERMETTQRLWNVKHLTTCRTSCDDNSYWCCVSEWVSSFLSAHQHIKRSLSVSVRMEQSTWWQCHCAKWTDNPFTSFTWTEWANYQQRSSNWCGSGYSR